MSKWCIDPNAEVEPDQTYDESEAAAPPEGPETTNQAQADPQSPETLYGAPPQGGDYDDYDLAPPPPLADEAFEQAESSFEEPVFEIDDTQQGPSRPNSLYDAPPSGPPRRGGGQQGGPRRGGGPRRNNRNGGGRRRGKFFT